ncbi:MAG: hypothetical protein OEY14_16820, partial [Myxococcales bacterium]|nr:hypothetical protein [Myxococcales bacterium]
FVWNEQEIRRTDQEIAQISERCRTGCSLDDERRGRQLEDAQSSQSTLRFLFPTLSLAGIGALIYGLVRWMGAPDDEAIERSASAALRLLPTPGGAALVGRF